MNMRIKRYLWSFLLILIPGIIHSQDVEKISPYLTFQYFKDTDNHRFLQTTLTYSSNRMEIPLAGMEIFFTGGDAALGTVVTGQKGIARLKLDDDLKLPAGEDGSWSFASGFAGNDTIEAASSDLVVKDADLEMKLAVTDSIKTVNLTAFTTEKGKRIPVKEISVMIYVPRMFSMLPVGEAYLDENGNAGIEFPSDLPGDDKGNLTIIARIEDNPDYGNIEKKASINWGLPKDISTPTSHRALWTKSPPMWMIITLSILLLGVWGHYMFAIISLVMIKIEAKRKKEKDEYQN